MTDTTDTGGLRALAESIAGALPAGWKVKSAETWYATLVRETDGAEIWFNGTHVTGMYHFAAQVRLEHRGHIPYDARTPIACNVSKNKDASAIARDITRRLLPALDVLAARTALAAGESASRFNVAQRVAATLVKAGPMLDAPVQRETDERVTFRFYTDEHGYGDGYVNGEGKVYMELRGISPEAARAVLRRIAADIDSERPLRTS